MDREQYLSIIAEQYFSIIAEQLRVVFG